MIIYNVTTKIDSAIQEDWLNWIKYEHIADILSTGCFTKANILQLLETDDAEGPTYAIQYHGESKALYNIYIEKHAVLMRQKAINKWGGQFISFRSVMQFVN